MSGSVEIINYNMNAHNIVSAAGRISTTNGGANEIYEKSCKNDVQKNMKLIDKILSSGHESVLEHISINLAFDNVSVFVEQFMIEFRLASFTVKSRRYVDFGKMGYFVPDFEQYENIASTFLENIYREYMDNLFDEYNFFIGQGIPKEDARFILPYSFKSNFYCTVNARELVKIMNEMVYGRGKDYPELVFLGESLFQQCEKVLPYLNLKKDIFNAKNAVKERIQQYPSFKGGQQYRKDDLVTLMGGVEQPERQICLATALNSGIANWFDVQIDDEEQQRLMIKDLLKGNRKRELEQVNFTILFNRISLAGVTHLVRHRMQSIIIPGYIDIFNFDEYVLPQSIVKAGLEKRYKDIFKKSKEVANQLLENGLYKYDLVYLLLSGLTIPVMTTMNANELNTFIRLRTCNRAQWEIKNCADALLQVLRKKHPVLFSVYGPSCYVMGECPEGGMTCGGMEEICQLYGGDSLDGVES